MTTRNVESLSDLELAQAVSQNHQLLLMAQDALVKLNNEIDRRNKERSKPTEAIKEQLESNAVSTTTTE